MHHLVIQTIVEFLAIVVIAGASISYLACISYRPEKRRLPKSVDFKHWL